MYRYRHTDNKTVKIFYALGMGSMGLAMTLWCRQWVVWWRDQLQAPGW